MWQILLALFRFYFFILIDYFSALKILLTRFLLVFSIWYLYYIACLKVMSFDRDLARLVPGHPRALEKCASMDRSHFLEDDHRRFKGQRQVRPLNLRILISFHTCFKLRYEVNKVKHAQVNYHEHSFTDHEKLNTKKVINIRLLQALQNTRSTNFNCIYSVACPCYRYFVCVLF